MAPLVQITKRSVAMSIVPSDGTPSMMMFAPESITAMRSLPSGDETQDTLTGALLRAPIRIWRPTPGDNPLAIGGGMTGTGGGVANCGDRFSAANTPVFAGAIGTCAGNHLAHANTITRASDHNLSAQRELSRRVSTEAASSTWEGRRVCLKDVRLLVADLQASLPGARKLVQDKEYQVLKTRKRRDYRFRMPQKASQMAGSCADRNS